MPGTNRLPTITTMIMRTIGLLPREHIPLSVLLLGVFVWHTRQRSSSPCLSLPLPSIHPSIPPSFSCFLHTASLFPASPPLAWSPFARHAAPSKLGIPYSFLVFLKSLTNSLSLFPLAMHAVSLHMLLCEGGRTSSLGMAWLWAAASRLD
ncbi:hypothetical protein IWX50DRAFT_366205 [Phyllosticta citricarpa]